MIQTGETQKILIVLTKSSLKMDTQIILNLMKLTFEHLTFHLIKHAIPRNILALALETLAYFVKNKKARSGKKCLF